LCGQDNEEGGEEKEKTKRGEDMEEEKQKREVEGKEGIK
jgi:hypothetical protein